MMDPSSPSRKSPRKTSNGSKKSPKSNSQSTRSVGKTIADGSMNSPPVSSTGQRRRSRPSPYNSSLRASSTDSASLSTSPKSSSSVATAGSSVRGFSISKTLTSLRSAPANRSCADCRAALVDPSTVYASFCISQSFQIKQQFEAVMSSSPISTEKINVALHDFHLTHQAFAPPNAGVHDRNPSGSSRSIKTDNSNDSSAIKKQQKRKSKTTSDDPSTRANQQFGGHGVFICSHCAEAHRQLGTKITTVQSVLDISQWTTQQVQFIMESGGNAQCWKIYEAYVPDIWKQRRPISSSSLSHRLLFCRAKYEALAFCLPQPGPLAEIAWPHVLEHNIIGRKYAGSMDLQNIISLSATKSYDGMLGITTNKTTSRTSKDGLPNRLVDHFCVVSSSMQLLPSQVKKDLSQLTSAEEFVFWPHVSDCYPDKSSHADMEFPDHLSSFVMPKGCHPTVRPKPPCFFSFVLTMGDGERLYGGALEIYDEHIDLEELRDAIENSDYVGMLPKFLLDKTDISDIDDSVQDTSDEELSDVVFFPRCLVILSHHAFFDLFRSVLLELYQITLMPAPLPIERYIQNFVHEIPLPPQGRVRVEFAFTSDKRFSIERPPINQLPMADFSFRPLFASLSISNIIVILGCLLEERKVVLLSNHYSMLTPVAEALLSAIFPFQWAGLYIPVVPLAMLDILDAPVPYLVGLDADYFHKVEVKYRPKDAILVDLDRDVIHMAGLEIPHIPSRDAQKLATALEEGGSSAYIIPNSGIKGCIMSGTEKYVLVPNEERPRYAYMTTMMALDADSLGRQEVFSTTDLAYGSNDNPTKNINGFGNIHGHMIPMEEETDRDGKKSKSPFKMKPMKTPKFMRNKKTDIISNSNCAINQGHLLETMGAKSFSVATIRNAFLRFTVTTFADYQDFLLPNSGRDLFDEKKFIEDTSLNRQSLNFLQNIIETQLFQRFLEERRENPEMPEIRFFDESITAKMNRSKKATLAQGGKKPTPFLDDNTWKVTKTFSPPPPSNLGLPDTAETYTYGTFPPLDPSRFGRIRPPAVWRQHSTREATRAKYAKRDSSMKKAQNDVVKRALRPIMSAPNAIVAAAGRTARDLDSALAAISMTPGRREKAAENAIPEKERSADIPKRKVNTLSKADTIMINARRKQTILLDIIVKIQSLVRAWLARLRLDTVRKSQGARALLINAKNEAELAKQRKAMQSLNAAVIQSAVRMFLGQRKFKLAIQAALVIQKNQRTSIAQQNLTAMKCRAVMIQKVVRAVRARRIYNEVRRLLSRLQARARGMQIRNRIRFIMNEQMALYTSQIFVLWTMVHTSLTLRTKLWPDLNGSQSFLRLRLAETELIRLWDIAGYSNASHSYKIMDKVTKSCGFVGLSSDVYCRSKVCVVWMRKLTPNALKSNEIAQALSVEESERLQIYERLNLMTSEKEIARIYRYFDIPHDDKLKKVSLSHKIWTNIAVADRSVMTMLKIFPELKNSLGITFHTASSKGHRRFPNASSQLPVPSLDQKFWNQISVEGNIKKHVQEVALLYITKVPALMARLENMTKTKKSHGMNESYRQALKDVYRTQTWEEARRIIIKEYLHGRYATKLSQSVEVVLSAAPDQNVTISSAGMPARNPLEGVADLYDKQSSGSTLKQETSNPFASEGNASNPFDSDEDDHEISTMKQEKQTSNDHSSFPDIELVKEEKKSEIVDFPNIEISKSGRIAESDNKANFPELI